MSARGKYAVNGCRTKSSAMRPVYCLPCEIHAQWGALHLRMNGTSWSAQTTADRTNMRAYFGHQPWTHGARQKHLPWVVRNVRSKAVNHASVVPICAAHHIAVVHVTPKRLDYVAERGME